MRELLAARCPHHLEYQVGTFRAAIEDPEFNAEPVAENARLHPPSHPALPLR